MGKKSKRSLSISSDDCVVEDNATASESPLTKFACLSGGDRSKKRRTSSSSSSSDGERCDKKDNDADIWANAMQVWNKTSDRLKAIRDKVRTKNVTTEETEALNRCAANDHACWTLLGRVNAEKCIQQFKLDDNQSQPMRNLISRVNALLRIIHETFIRRGTAPKFALTTTVTTTATASTEESIVPIISELDANLLILARLMVDRTDPKSMYDLDDYDHFATLNAITSSEHEDYLYTRIEYKGTYTPKRGESSSSSTISPRHNLRGIFLVSLREIEAGNGMRFKSWRDVDNHLQTVSAAFIVNHIFDGKKPNANIYLNVSMRKNTKHFNVLNQGIGTLALVQLAFATHDVTKNRIIVKAYVICTMSDKDNCV